MYNITISHRHPFDIGTNREFKVKFTSNDDRPAYSQSLPTPINLKDDITVELALLHRYGIITTLPFSKYASPIFTQRKPNGRLHLLVDLRKINNLITQKKKKLTLDGLKDTGALTSAISEADLNKIKLLSNEAIKDTGPAPNF